MKVAFDRGITSLAPCTEYLSLEARRFASQNIDFNFLRRHSGQQCQTDYTGGFVKWKLLQSYTFYLDVIIGWLIQEES